MTPQEFAVNVSQEVKHDGGPQIGIEIILAILSVVVQQCIINYFRAKNPSFIDRIRLKWLVRSHTKQRGVTEALIRQAATLTEDQFVELNNKLRDTPTS